ncbi:putative tetratricopeptide repeat protein 41 isoform X4 [Canis lupus familiaris]|uniref:putative tetratricopeptide repeat protein 41 isoform X4 n=1 Tax=Canis lupus familiaris TaxID=9615 RepID=UPI0015F1754C|nr:putative tetratricopeptide repeat protein 41 isoform X4 [Canis lupus familiaris]
MKMSGSWGDLCSSLLSSPSITDFISKIQNSSFWTRLHLIHYWSMLSEVGYDAAGAYVFTVSKIKADRCHKARRRCSLSVLECRLFEVTTINKCRLMFFIGKFLKLIGKTKEAEGLFLNIENMLAQSQALTQVLPTVQNATREFYLEVGLTHEGFQCFQKAWSNLMEFSPGDIKDNQDVVRQKAGQLLMNDSGHHIMTEAVGYLYRSLDLRATYLGSSHSSIHGILQLLREIEWIRSRR